MRKSLSLIHSDFSARAVHRCVIVVIFGSRCCDIWKGWMIVEGIFAVFWNRGKWNTVKIFKYFQESFFEI